MPQQVLLFPEDARAVQVFHQVRLGDLEPEVLQAPVHWDALGSHLAVAFHDLLGQAV